MYVKHVYVYMYMYMKLFVANCVVWMLPQSAGRLVPERGNEWLSLDGSTVQTTHSCAQTDPSRENKSVPGDVFQQLSEWLTVSPSKLHIQQMALSVSIWAAAQKDNSSVCAWGDYSIPLLPPPPLPPLHSHTNPGLLTPRNSEITQTHKKENTTRTHTGSMGKFLTTSKRERRSSNPLGRKKGFFLGQTEKDPKTFWA